MPSISFLVHISPAAYLDLTDKKQPTTQSTLPLDIGLADLKKRLTGIRKGVTIATLYLEERSVSGMSQLYPGSMSMPNVMPRPTFPLFPSAAEFDHAFPQINHTGLTSTSNSLGPYGWLLDFTDGGRRGGVVMSQSRMKAIELMVNPLAMGNDLSGMGDSGVGGGSWVDLLVCSGILTGLVVELMKSS